MHRPYLLALSLPLFAGIGYPLRLVVVSGLNDVSQYLNVPGVARVLTGVERGSACPQQSARAWKCGP